MASQVRSLSSAFSQEENRVSCPKVIDAIVTTDEFKAEFAIYAKALYIFYDSVFKPKKNATWWNLESFEAMRMFIFMEDRKQTSPPALEIVQANKRKFEAETAAKAEAALKKKEQREAQEIAFQTRLYRKFPQTKATLKQKQAC